MGFDANNYGRVVAELLALDGGGFRLMPLAAGICSNSEAAGLLRSGEVALSLQNARHPLEAVAGLWLYFSCLDESHHVSQSVDTREGAYWHAIMHRQELDYWNAKYWFRRVGTHPIFSALRSEASTLAEKHGSPVSVPSSWDAGWFVDLCETAASPGHPQHTLAREIQRAEWQLLFNYCASPAAP